MVSFIVRSVLIPGKRVRIIISYNQTMIIDDWLNFFEMRSLSGYYNYLDVEHKKKYVRTSDFRKEIVERLLRQLDNAVKSGMSEDVKDFNIKKIENYIDKSFAERHNRRAQILTPSLIV